MFTRASRAVLAFGLVASVSMLTLATATRAASTFFSLNLMPASERNWLLGVTLGSAVLMTGLALVLLRRDLKTSVVALEFWARLVSPVLVLPFLLALLRADFGTDPEAALLLAAAALGGERLARVSLEAWQTRPWRSDEVRERRWLAVLRAPATPLTVLVVLAAGQALLMGVWSVWSHQRFGTYGFDLGQYDSVFANTLHGNWLAMPPLRLNQPFSDVVYNHADFGTFLLLPVYALFPDAKTLLVLQALFVAGAAVPLYFFAVRRLGSRWQAFVVGAMWLAYAPMHSAQLYDYHWQLVGAALVVCALAALESRRMVLYWLLFVAAILCREDVSIGLTVFGLFLVLSGERPKVGVATALLAVGYFGLLRFGVMRSVSFAGIYSDLRAPDMADGFGSILKTLISNPAYAAKTLITWEKARYLAQIFAPLVFLPMRRPLLWLLMVPGFFLSVLSTGYAPTISISFQYVGNWAGWMFFAAVLALSAWQGDAGQLRRRAALTAMVAASLVAAVHWGAYTPRGSIRGGFVEVPLRRPSADDVAREAALRELLQLVPAEAALCTSERVQPHTTSLHLKNHSLRGGTHDCDFLLFSAMPDDHGAPEANAALASRAFRVKERKAGVTLAERVPPRE